MFCEILVQLLLCWAVGGSFLKNCICGRNSESHTLTPRIIGGHNLAPHEHPWLVAIFHIGRLHCGGALINDRYIVTAGHCVKWIKIPDLTLVFGLHNINRPEVGLLAKIKRIIVHEDFTSYLLHDTNDIALLELARRVTFQDNIQPVCLPQPNSIHEEVDAFVSGWGRIGTRKIFSELPKVAKVTVKKKQFCLGSLIGEQFTDGMLCSYSEGKDSCQGDSGGPLVYKRNSGSYELIGVISWGIGCGTKGVPSVSTKVTKYLGWIERKTSNAVYCGINY